MGEVGLNKTMNSLSGESTDGNEKIFQYSSQSWKSNFTLTVQFLEEPASAFHETRKCRVLELPDERRAPDEAPAVLNQIPEPGKPLQITYFFIGDMAGFENIIGRQRRVNHPPFFRMPVNGCSSQAL